MCHRVQTKENSLSNLYLPERPTRTSRPASSRPSLASCLSSSGSASSLPMCRSRRANGRRTIWCHLTRAASVRGVLYCRGAAGETGHPSETDVPRLGTLGRCTIKYPDHQRLITQNTFDPAIADDCHGLGCLGPQRAKARCILRIDPYCFRKIAPQANVKNAPSRGHARGLCICKIALRRTGKMALLHCTGRHKEIQKNHQIAHNSANITQPLGEIQWFPPEIRPPTADLGV